MQAHRFGQIDGLDPSFLGAFLCLFHLQVRALIMSSLDLLRPPIFKPMAPSTRSHTDGPNGPTAAEASWSPTPSRARAWAGGLSAALTRIGKGARGGCRYGTACHGRRAMALEVI